MTNKYQFKHSLVKTLFSPLIPDKFDKVFSRLVGENYATFYSGRFGVYYILKYLNNKYGCSRIHLSDYFINAGQSVPLVSEKAGYKILWYKDKPINVRKNDVVLLIDKNMKIPKDVFSIQDSASNLQSPSNKFDFVLYAFGQNKPLSSAGGGSVVVVNQEMLDFLEIKSHLHQLEFKRELKCYTNSITWWAINFYLKLENKERKQLIVPFDEWKMKEGNRKSLLEEYFSLSLPKMTRKLISSNKELMSKWK